MKNEINHNTIVIKPSAAQKMINDQLDGHHYQVEIVAFN